MRDVELHHRALDGLPEADVHLIFQVVARFGTLHLLAAPAAEDVGEDVAEPACASRPASGSTRTFGEVVEVEAAEIERHFLGVSARSARAWAAGPPNPPAATVGLGCGRIDVVGVEAELIVNLALLGIAEDVVGFGKRLELFLGRLIAGIHIGVILARQLAEGLADVVRRRGLLDPESRVVVLVFVGRGGH